MKSLLFKVAAVALSLLLVLLGLETVVRVFNLAQPRAGQQDPIFGTSYIPGQSYLNQHGVRVDVGEHGFRGPTPQKSKPAGLFRVALLGDSFLHAQAVAYEQTFYGRLNDQFRREGRPVELINFGVEGFGTVQEYLVYHHLAASYRPDLVILFFYVGNDLDENYPPSEHRPGFRLVNGELQPVPFTVRGDRRGPVKDFLRKNCRLYNYLPDLFRSAAANISGRLSEEEIARRQETHRQQFALQGDASATVAVLKVQELSEAWLTTLKVIEKLHQEVTTNGSKLALCVLPMMAQVYDHYWEQLQARYKSANPAGWDRMKPQEILKRFADQRQIYYLPFSEEMMSRVRQIGTMYYLEADYHFNPTAHELLAQVLKPALEAMAK